MRQLPQFKHKSTTYTIDERLKEIRWMDYLDELCFADFDSDRGREVMLAYKEEKC